MTVRTPFRLLITGAALLAWTALILRLYLTMTTLPGNTPLQSFVGYLSFFTIETNILGAAILTAWVWPGGSGWLARPGVRASAVVYLGVVGVVYAILLRDLWDPRGLAKFCDVVLHDIMPVLYALCWLLAAPKGLLRWRQTVWWLVFPALYLAYSLARGAVTGIYPYPFINAAKLGYDGVAINAAMLLAAFWGLSLLMVAIDRLLGRRSGA